MKRRSKDMSAIILHCSYPDCLMEFNNRWSLTRHEKTHNVDVKPYKCSMCEGEFMQKCSLRRHIKTHSDGKPFQCTHPNCGKRFKLKEYLDAHRRIHVQEDDIVVASTNNSDVPVESM